MPLSVYHTYMRFRSQGLEAVFEEALSGIDVIVFGGGSLIKYKYQDIYWYVHKALEVANTMRIPV